MMATQTFPKDRVIGCRYIATEGNFTYRGIVDDVIDDDGNLRFYTRNNEDERPQHSEQWYPTDELRVFGFNEKENSGSWRYDNDGNIIVAVPYIGEFTILLP